MSAVTRKASSLFIGILGLLALGATSASAAPVWDVVGHHGPSVFKAGQEASYSFDFTNVGDETATGPTRIEIELPDGVTTRVASSLGVGPATIYASKYWLWNPFSEETFSFTPCPGAAGESQASCEFPLSVPPGDDDNHPGLVTVFVDVPADAVGPLTAKATVSSPNAEPVTVTETAPVGTSDPPFGIVPGSFEADAFDEENAEVRQAGSHPFIASAAFDLNLERNEVKNVVDGQPGVWAWPIDMLRNVETLLPRGLSGNPLAVERCPVALLLRSTGGTGETSCPPATQVGVIDISLMTIAGPGGTPITNHFPVHNLIPPPGALAAFGFSILGTDTYLVAKLDPSDYSVVVEVKNVSDFLPVYGQKLRLWGVPGDPVHDPARWNPEALSYGAAFEGPVKPFVSLPTECNVPDSTVVTRLNSWRLPNHNAAPDGISSEPVAVNGCDQLQFEPKVEIKPTTNVAEAPTGLEFDLHIPQSEDPEALATAHLRDAVVKLPAGMTVNPPSADGLGACSMSEVSLGTNDPVRCPDTAKLGTAEVESPAIDHPVKGSVYLAEQNANPFGSLLAMYLVLEDEQTGLLVKLPGKADPDLHTGQITATFKNNPQLPVEDIRLKLKEGPRAPLKTPSTCGAHTTEATFTPWSAPEAADVSKQSSFELTQGPSGGACLNGGGGAPNSPAFSAGTMDPTAKAFSPFVFRLARADGSQQIKAIETTLPKGLVAKLAGTTYCSDASLAAAAGKSGKAEKASASCPASSRVGSVNVGAGVGSTPLYVPGEAYLAGPYKGAPLSLAIITPAVAGPFDLGTVVVRTALHVNSETAQVKAVSDELPTILQGIPLNIRSIALKMDRPQFILNPTSCDPMSVNASALSVFGQSAPLTNRFQVGECTRLGFKPKLQMRFSGSTKRSGHPALKAVLTARPGDANIARAQVTLPKTEFLAQEHIRTICTRVQYAAKSCPKGAVYGYAKAWTPLLDQPLEGPVYLRSSSNKLPDLVADLNGQLEVDLIGRIDSPKAMIRNTFELVPDAPVSKFVLTMQGAKKGLLVNNTNLCKAKPRLSATFEAQNGKVAELAPLVKTDCGKKGRKGGKGKKRGGGK